MATITGYPGDIKTGTFTVGGSDSGTVPCAGYDITFTNSDPTVVQVQLDPVTRSDHPRTLTATLLKAGSSAVVVTLTPKAYWGGSVRVLSSDTFSVSAKRTVSSATVAWA